MLSTQDLLNGIEPMKTEVDKMIDEYEDASWWMEEFDIKAKASGMRERLYMLLHACASSLAAQDNPMDFESDSTNYFAESGIPEGVYGSVQCLNSLESISDFEERMGQVIDDYESDHVLRVDYLGLVDVYYDIDFSWIACGIPFMDMTPEQRHSFLEYFED